MGKWEGLWREESIVDKVDVQTRNKPLQEDRFKTEKSVVNMLEGNFASIFLYELLRGIEKL